jgi:multiple sugar transport system permease protein
MAPGMALLLFYSIFPLVYNLYLSFNEWQIRAKVFQPVGFKNWSELVTNADNRVYNSLGITLQYTIIALIIQLLLGIVIALLLDSRPWGVGLMQSMMILPMVTAPAVAGMMFRLLEHANFGAISWAVYQMGIIKPAEPLLGGTGANALAAVILVDIWQWTPFITLIVLAGLKGLPIEILEAAEVDGANWWQRFFLVKLPLLRGVLTVAILFRLIDLYKVFDYVKIMTSGGPGLRTESLSFYGYVNTFQLLRWGYGAAVGLAVMMIAWISVFLFQKVFKIKW